MSAALHFQPILAPVVDVDRDELEESVIEACRRRDPQALRTWVSRYERPVFAFLSRSLGSGPHIEDLAQEVFVRAFAALDRFDPHGPARLTTWMLSIAWRVAQEARRKRAVPPMHPADAAHFVHDPGTPEQRHARQELAHAFEQAASQLPEDQLDVFVLAEFHGLTMSEIANMLGVPEATVKTRLFRAREKLRKLLAPIREA
jgi:RNA polymerase sigma-70 factor, ECF subfamily